MRIPTTLACALLASAVSGAAAASPAGMTADADITRVTVTKSASAQAIHDEIVEAAMHVCMQTDLEGVRARRAVERCVEATVEDAVRRSGLRELQVFHERLPSTRRYTVAGAP